MGRKLGLCPLFWGGGAGSPSNTKSPGLRPTSIPSGILMPQAVWPQRKWVKNWGLCPLFGRPFAKRFALCYRSVVCPVCLSVLSVLSVCDVRALWPNSWTDQNETWHAGRPRPGHIVLYGDPAPPPPKEHSPHFWPISVATKWLHGSR